MSIITPESCIPTREASIREEENAQFIARMARLKRLREAAHDARKHDAEPDPKCYLCAAIAKEAWERKRDPLRREADAFLETAGYSLPRGKWSR